MVGLLQGVPLMWVIMATALTFAGVGVGLNGFSQLRYRRSPADKVSITGPRVDVAPVDIVNKTGVRFISLGIMARNIAEMPLEVSIDQLDTRIENRIPDREFNPQSTLVDARTGVVGFKGSPISLEDMNLGNRRLNGVVDARISYGYPEKRKFSAEVKWYFNLVFKDGNFVHYDHSPTEFIN